MSYIEYLKYLVIMWGLLFIGLSISINFKYKEFLNDIFS